ncbi:hypothetical protein Q5530_22615 [Saccharothrix sp. BKS2]|uniref:PE family protein n=1 Tax=Saccharothrix lopnurensis TaxID=1670621 RepID=A0ABW1P092_9PSEU
MVRVRGVEDAQRLREELKDDERGRGSVDAPDVAAPTGAGAAGVVADGAADRIELDLDEFTRAGGELERLRGELVELLRRAEGEVDQPLGDGQGPVALHMRRAFGLRAGEVGGGVRVALRSYLRELDALREALDRVGKTHQAEDEEAKRTMGRLA